LNRIKTDLRFIKSKFSFGIRSMTNCFG
jgi:hypothetical protein